MSVSESFDFDDASHSNLLSGTPIPSSSSISSHTGPGGADLSLSELSLSDRPEGAYSRFCRVAPHSMAPGDAPSSPTTRQMGKRREDKLQEDLFVLKRLNAALSSFNEALGQVGSQNELIATQLEQTEGLLNEYVDILSQSEQFAQLLLDENWHGADEDEAAIRREREEEEERVRKAEAERVAAAHQEKERRLREEKERAEQQEREQAERDKRDRVPATRGGVRGVRGTRASMRAATRARGGTCSPSGYLATLNRWSRPLLPLPIMSRTKFTLSGPPSAASSRTTSPAPEDPMDVYEATLPRFRAAVRRKLVASIKTESRIIAQLQDAIRTPFLDRFFIYTSALGSHTFFSIFIPIFFFFGHDDLGEGLVITLAVGIYLTSVAKDLFCSPRPFAPPVTRMTIGTHHLEYGFPSTHSANSVSIALLFWAYFHELAFPNDGEASMAFPVYVACTAGLVFYVASVVFGRIYLAMHSFTDCIVGVVVGIYTWVAYTSFRGIPISFSIPLSPSTALSYNITVFRGWGVGAWVDNWIAQTPASSFRVPLTLIPLALLAVNQHPQPVDDCPCFEDAVAIGSVAIGMLVGRWGAARFSPETTHFRKVLMPHSGWVLSDTGIWESVPRTWADDGLWWSIALCKMLAGILAIVVWRLCAKFFMHRLLPPIFRGLAKLVRLPNRRFYTPATDYTDVPPVDALHPVPSVIDLTSTAGVEIGGIGSGYSALNGSSKNGLRRRAEAVEAARGGGAHVRESEAAGEEVKRYDADVLTKLVVYAGIAVLVIEVAPVCFGQWGWGTRSWP
ncbi:Sphingosine-1-phosphate phosphatase [Mycena kentingensis (nom. inval.)]|nr:Sphingosine-1-phosphate phosphatase [Mycena kentingensis (nom. inval.)]